MLPALLGRPIRRVALRRGEAVAPATAHLRPASRGIRKHSFLAPLLFPIGLAIALVIVGAVGLSVWNIHSASEARRSLHQAPVQSSKTEFASSVSRQVADSETEFVLRLVDGRLVRVIADKGEVSAFIGAALHYLEGARARANQQALGEIDQLFAEVFATREADLDAYADWFFAWGRSWRFLYEAATGAVQEMGRLFFSQTQVSDAARHAVEAYLLRHYQDFVLKPALRDDIIDRGLRQALRNAHREYLMALAGLDDYAQRFLAEQTGHVEEIDDAAVVVRIDWDAEKWKAPRYTAEDRYLEPVISVAVIGGSAALGGIVQRAVLPLVARTTAQVLASSQFTVGGAAAGLIQPGLGTAVGAIAGAGLDWGLSVFRHYMERDDFIRDNAAALDATISAWKAIMSPEISRAIDVWFDDTTLLLAKLDQAN
jgi:nitrate reductase NapE component